MALRFKTDENLPEEARSLIEDRGYDAQSVVEEGLSGHLDREVIGQCREESRVLVTLDRGLADIRTYPPGSNPGMLLLRPSSQSIGEILKVLGTALDLIDQESPSHQLWIVEPGRVRVRQ